MVVGSSQPGCCGSGSDSGMEVEGVTVEGAGTGGADTAGAGTGAGGGVDFSWGLIEQISLQENHIMCSCYAPCNLCP